MNGQTSDDGMKYASYKAVERDKVKAELVRVIAKKAEVTDAITALIHERQRTGKTADNRYWGKLLDEQSRLQVKCRALEAVLADIGRPQKDTYRGEFIGVAKERLPPAVYAEWREEALRRANSRDKDTTVMR